MHHTPSRGHDGGRANFIATPRRCPRRPADRTSTCIGANTILVVPCLNYRTMGPKTLLNSLTKAPIVGARERKRDALRFFGGLGDSLAQVSGLRLRVTVSGLGFRGGQSLGSKKGMCLAFVRREVGFREAGGFSFELPSSLPGRQPSGAAFGDPRYLVFRGRFR